jgi:DNA-binding NarL/FixJ family response regulator
MSETLKAVIVDALTGIVIERDFTAEEIAEHEANLEIENQAKAEAQAKAAARASALAKLADLGLTAEEIAAL